MNRLTVIIASLILFFPNIISAQEQESNKKLISYMESCQYSQAIDLADRYLSQDSTNLDLLLLKGRALAAGYQFKESVEVLLKAEKTDSTNIKILNELVNVYKQAGDAGNAIATSYRITQLVPDNRYFSLQLANLFYSENEYRRTIQVLLPLFKADSSSYYVVKQLALSLDELKHSDSAELFYRRALATNPFDPFVTGKLANLYIRLKKTDMALAVTRNYLKQDSTNIQILKQDAYCSYYISDFRASVKQFRRCLALGDQSKFTSKYLGMSYYRQEKYDTAAPFFRLAFLSDTNDAETCFYYGVCEARTFGIDTGLVYLNRTLRLLMPPAPFLSTLYTELASAYTNHRQPDTAIALLQKALDANSRNNTLRFKIAYQYDYYLRQPDKALPHYREYLRNAELLKESKASLPLQLSMVSQTDTGEYIFSYGDYAKNRIEEITGAKKKADRQ
jgi:lipopolysaccharide biosynthesis regulator YciM